MIRIRFILNKISLVIFFLGIPPGIFAQVSFGARGLALGGATVALPDYNWSVLSNPALLNSKTPTLGFYGLRNYGFVEITDVSVFGSIPTQLGVGSFAIHKYGDHLFSETRATAGYKNDWENLHFGVVLNYNHISFGGVYGSGGAFGMDIGISTRITQQLWLGAKASNVNSPKYNFANSSEYLKRDLTIGLSYLMNKNVLFALDMFKDIRYPVSFKSGLEGTLVRDFKGRVGVTTEPLTYSFGFGYEKRNWAVNMAVQQHSLLGLSPGFDLLFFF
ncbi:MAG: hypothetical protein RLN81_08515 [Balneolaceae bacterium]